VGLRKNELVLNIGTFACENWERAYGSSWSLCWSKLGWGKRTIFSIKVEESNRFVRLCIFSLEPILIYATEKGYIVYIYEYKYLSDILCMLSTNILLKIEMESMGPI
jgi:hypothetical protein